MKRILLLLVLCLGTLTLQGQGFQWLQNGGGNNIVNGSSFWDKEQVIDMATDSNRNIYVLSVIAMSGVEVNNNPPIAVNTFEQNPYRTDFILISYACDGTYRWHKVFGGGGFDYPSGIQIDSQNNVYISGRVTQCSNNDGSDPFYSIPRIGDNTNIDYTFNTTLNSCQQIFLAKFNNTGVFQWIHFPHDPLTITATQHIRIMRNFYMVNDVIHWIVQLAPGSYENGAFTNTNTTATFLYYVLKYDTNGTFISATPFDLQFSNYPTGELRWYRNPNNGNYYVVYFNTANITVTAGGNSLTPNLPKIICFNNLGQYLWHRETTGTSMNFQSLNFDIQNNIYVTGVSVNYTALTNSFLGWSLPGTNTGFASFIMKCNPTMTSYYWVSNHSPGSAKGENDIYYTPNQIYFVGAVNQSTFTWGTQTITGPGPNNDFDPFLATFDPSTGNCNGLHRLIGGNGFDDGFTKIIQDNNGDIILGGFMGYDLTDDNGTSYYSYGGNTDFFITKFASQACPALGTSLFEETSIRLYPNPSKGLVTLDYQLEAAVQLQVIDVSGRVVLERELSAAETSVQFATTAMASGVYAVQVLGSDDGVWRSKLVVE
jgi:hypothetical protein